MDKAQVDTDLWLQRWLPKLFELGEAPALLELGCGEGRDTQFLLGQGFSNLTAFDRSAEAVSRCQQHSAALKCFVHDLREPFPCGSASFDGVLASLCLHYFAWDTTEAIVSEIARVLKPGGLLLCRVNSTHDVHYGAVGYPEIAPHLYEYRGRTKRFFDQQEVEKLFLHGWSCISLEEKQIDRYQHPKVVWEIVLRKV